MQPFEAFIVRTDRGVRDLSTARLVLVLTDTPEEVIATFIEKCPGWTVELTGREFDEREAGCLKPGEPT